MSLFCTRLASTFRPAPASCRFRSGAFPLQDPLATLANPRPVSSLGGASRSLQDPDLSVVAPEAAGMHQRGVRVSALASYFGVDHHTADNPCVGSNVKLRELPTRFVCPSPRFPQDPRRCVQVIYRRHEPQRHPPARLREPVRPVNAGKCKIRAVGL